MASTFTTNKYLEEPGTNDQVNTWGATLNSNFSRIDSAFGGTTSINLNGVTGNLDLANSYPLPSTAPYSYIGGVIILSGTPSGIVNIRVPSGVGGVWSIYANFGGSYAVNFLSIGGGTSVPLVQGYNNQVMSDGTNIRALTLGGLLVGTAATNLVALDATAKLPAVDGSQLTNVTGVPVGCMMSFAGSTAPTGWLLCDGSSLLVAGTYNALFSVPGIGYTYGGSGGNFSIPDLRGRVLAGKDNMGGTAVNRLTTAGSGVNGVTLGASGGAQSVTLDATMIPAHTHTFTISTRDYSGSGSSSANYLAGVGVNTITTTSTGGGLAHNNTQPTFIANTIIKY